MFIIKKNFDKILYALVSASSSFVSFALYAIVALSSTRDSNNLIVFLFFSVGSGFFQSWFIFFCKTADNIPSSIKDLKFYILFLPVLILSIILFVLDSSLCLPFIIGIFQSLFSQSCIINGLGFYSLLYSFISNVLLILFYTLFSSFSPGFSLLSSSIYFIVLIVFVAIFLLNSQVGAPAASNIIVFERLAKKRFKKIAQVSLSSCENLFSSFLVLALPLLISITYSFTPLLIPVMSSVVKTTSLLVLIDKINFTICSTLNSHFMAKGFLFEKSCKIKAKRVAIFAFCSMLFSLLVILFIVELSPKLSPLLSNSRSMKNFQEGVSSFSMTYLFLVVILSSLTNSLSVNTGYPLRFVQLNFSTVFNKIKYQSIAGFILRFVMLVAITFGVMLAVTRMSTPPESYNLLSFLVLLAVLSWWVFAAYQMAKVSNYIGSLLGSQTQV